MVCFVYIQFASNRPSFSICPYKSFCQNCSSITFAEFLQLICWVAIFLSTASCSYFSIHVNYTTAVCSYDGVYLRRNSTCSLAASSCLSIAVILDAYVSVIKLC